MLWIEASLAFAITMMIFSTIVSVVVETAHRIFRVREKGLQHLMQHMYSQIIEPRLFTKPPSNGAAIFQAHMTRARFLPAKKSWLLGINRIINAEHLTSLSTAEFIERLAETPAGKKLIQLAEREGSDYLKLFLEDLVNKYEDFGESASEYFKRKAGLYSIITAMALAFALNVNAVHLFQTFLVDKDLRSSLIDQGQQVATFLEQQQEKLETELSQSNQDSTPDNLQQIQSNVIQAKDLVADIESAGVPIGWHSAPWQSSQWQQADTARYPWLQQTKLILVWLACLLFSGILIGLGGPFWFDTYKKISVLAGLSKNFQSEVQNAKATVQKFTNKVNLVEIFEKAVKASDLHNKALD